MRTTGILTAAALAGALLAAGCTKFGEKGSRAALTEALDAHAETVRWGGTRGLENVRGVRITDFEVRSVRFDNKDRTKATVRVEVQGYGPRMNLETWHLEQKWVERGDSWAIAAERRVDPKAEAAKAAKKTAAAPTVPAPR